MKTKQKASMVAILVAGITLISGANAQDIKIINHGGASLPRESENQPAFRGESWESASANWMLLLRNGGSQLGSSRSQVVRKQDLGDYKEMLTSTAHRTWKGMDDAGGPTVEWGNFWHQGVQIVASNGATFIPAEVSVRVRSFTGSTPGSLDRTVTFTALNGFRQILNPNNTVASVQNQNASATNFLYGGVGVALTMGGSGTVQQMLDGTANYWWDQDYKLEYTVIVPYTPSGGGAKQSTSLTWVVERMKPTTTVEGNQIVITNTAQGKTYKVYNSPNLADWTLHESFNGGGTPSITMTHMGSTSTFPKMFYRLEY